MSGKSPRGQQVLAVAAMYIGYAMFMVLRMIPAAVGGAMREDETLDVELKELGEIFALGTCGAIVGKFIGGYSADKLGGKLTFAIGLAVCSVFIGLFATSNSLMMFQLSLFFAFMAKSLGWPSMTKIISHWFRPSEYGRIWGIISTSSRVGTMIAIFGFGAMLWLMPEMPWRNLLFLYSGVGLLVAMAFFLLLKEKPPESDASGLEEDTESPDSDMIHHPLNGTTIWQALPRFAGSLQFWLITGSLMALTILWEFLQLVPSFLQDRLSLPVEQASMAASTLALG